MSALDIFEYMVAVAGGLVFIAAAGAMVGYCVVLVIALWKDSK